MKFYRITALLLKYWYISINRFDRLFDVFYWPLLDLVIWGFASAYIQDISEYNLLSMFLGGIILWVFLWRASQDIAVYVLEDFWSKNLYHLFSSPVTLTEHVTSIILVGFLRSLVTFAFLTFFAALLYQFNFFTLPFIFIGAAVFLLLLFGWFMGFLVVSLILRYGQRIQVLAWSITWVIQPFSCVFYPLSALPAWAKPIASVLPTPHIFENLRSLLFQGVINWSSLGYSFCVELVLLFLGGWFLKKSFEHARYSGLLAKSD